MKIFSFSDNISIKFHIYSTDSAPISEILFIQLSICFTFIFSQSGAAAEADSPTGAALRNNEVCSMVRDEIRMNYF